MTCVVALTGASVISNSEWPPPTAGEQSDNILKAVSFAGQVGVDVSSGWSGEWRDGSCWAGPHHTTPHSNYSRYIEDHFYKLQSHGWLKSSNGNCTSGVYFYVDASPGAMVTESDAEVSAVHHITRPTLEPKFIVSPLRTGRVNLMTNQKNTVLKKLKLWILNYFLCIIQLSTTSQSCCSFPATLSALCFPQNLWSWLHK